MMPAGKFPIVMRADQEHGGIRLAVFITLFVGFLIGFRLVLFLLETFAPPVLLDYAIFLSCVGAAPVALLITWVVEKALKRVWPSGISLILDEWGIRVRDRRTGEQRNENSGAQSSLEHDLAAPTMTWGANMGQLNWYFRLSGYARGGRERRIPAKWYCLATELQQDELRLGVFTFLPPDATNDLVSQPGRHFQLLNLAELYQSGVRSRIGPPSRPTLPNNLLQSREGRYWLAERRRWEYGLELTPKDFTTLIDHAQHARRGLLAAEDRAQSKHNAP
jgi:hypothetical protein